MNESAAPSPNKPPKTMPIRPVKTSPRRNSTMASSSNATAQPNIQKPRKGAELDGTCPVETQIAPNVSPRGDRGLQCYRMPIPFDQENHSFLQPLLQFTLYICSFGIVGV